MGVALIFRKGRLQFGDRFQGTLKSRLRLRIPPVVEQRDVLHALNRAAWGTGLEGVVLVTNVLRRITFQWDGRITTLL